MNTKARTAVLEHITEYHGARIEKTEDAIQEMRREAHEMRIYWKVLGVIASIGLTVFLTWVASQK